MSDYSAVAPPQNINHTAFAAALQRARQIAAKINPGAATGDPSRQKRPLDDSGPEPEPKKLAGLDFPNNQAMSPAKKFPGLGSQGGNVTQVEIMVPGPKVGLIIGKGGETIKQLQEKSGAKMVVIQEGPNPEQEKPLRITGDPQKVEYAKQLVYDLIAEKEMQAYRGGPRGGGAPPNQGNQMNRDNRGGPGGYQGGNGDGDFGGNNGGNGNGEGVEVQVPRAAVGVVIGKGGDMIKKIQAETGARVQFQQGRDDGPGDRRCYLTGKPQNVEAARQRIEELIDSVHRRDNEGGNNQGPNPGRNNGRPGGNNGGQGGRNDFNNSNANQRNGGYGAPQWGGPGGNQSQIEVTFQVPTYKCGVIIGRGGETIKQINQQSGAHCELDRRAQSGNGQEKTFIIRGDAECVENAKRIISEKIQMPLYFTPTSNSAGAPQGMAPGPMNPAAMPTAYPGMAPQQAYTPQQQWAAPGAPGPDTTTAAYPQQWPQQSTAAAAATQIQINPQTGQPDYSKQWAEYYRSLGMHREADMIEQQAKGGAVPVQAQPAAATVTPVAGQQPAATQVTSANGTVPAAGGAVAGAAQPDYSAQWAEYYRSIGKIKEAEAIEAQMKNKAASGIAATSTAAAVSVAGAAAVTSTPSAPVQAAAAVVTATPAQPFAGYANYGGYYAQTQQQPLATAAGAPPAGATPQAQYGFPGYGQAYGQPQPQAENTNN